MKRYDISGLEKNRSIYFKLGLIIAVGFAVMAFNWTSVHYENEALELKAMQVEDDIQVVRTVHEQKRQLPPPIIKPSENFMPDDDPVFIETPIPPIDPVAPSTPIPSDPVDVSTNVTPPTPAKPPVLPQKKQEEAPPIFKIVEEMPRFGDCVNKDLNKAERSKCSDQAVLEFVYQHIKYPAFARDNDIEGVVVVQFIIEKDGAVSNAKILRDIGGGCGKEVMRVIDKMPDWSSPGMQRGRPVRVQINLPVSFKLK